MPNPVAELRAILTQSLLGTTSGSASGHTSEGNLIDFLCEVIREYGVGGYETEEVVAIFRQHNIPRFDILAWIESKRAEGVYVEEYEPD